MQLSSTFEWTLALKYGWKFLFWDILHISDIQIGWRKRDHAIINIKYTIHRCESAHTCRMRTVFGALISISVELLGEMQDVCVCRVIQNIQNSVYYSQYMPNTDEYWAWVVSAFRHTRLLGAIWISSPWLFTDAA